jgi:hypothetical protein
MKTFRVNVRVKDCPVKMKRVLHNNIDVVFDSAKQSHCRQSPFTDGGRRFCSLNKDKSQESHDNCRRSFIRVLANNSVPPPAASV